MQLGGLFNDERRVVRKEVLPFKGIRQAVGDDLLYLPHSSSLQRRPLASPVPSATAIGKGKGIILPSINAGSSFRSVIRFVRNEGIKTDRPAEQFNKFGMTLVAFIAAAAGHEPHPPRAVGTVKAKAIALRAAFIGDELRHRNSKDGIGQRRNNGTQMPEAKVNA